MESERIQFVLLSIYFLHNEHVVLNEAMNMWSEMRQYPLCVYKMYSILVVINTRGVE